MIFDCPRCEAENAIPVADIPPEGKVAMCSGCKQPFRVLPPDPEDVDEPDDGGFESNAETTTVGAPPAEFDEAGDDPTSGFFVPPVHAPAGGAPEDVAPPLIARDTSDLPPEVLGGGTSAAGSAGPPASASAEISGTDDTLLPADGRALGRRLRSRPNDDRTPPSGTPAVIAPALSRPSTTPVAVPVPAAAPLVATAAPLPWHKRVPLAAKVGAAVFPIALLVAVILRPGASANDAPPIALPVAPRAQTASIAAPTPTPTATPDASPVEDPIDPELSPLAHDKPAEDGYLYVSAEAVVLRSRAGGGGMAGETLRRGTLVRQVQRVDAATLVWVEPAGPAGFVPAASLDARVPLATLAESIAFEACSDRATCVEGSRRQAARCAMSCSAVDPSVDEEGRTRCREACAAARTRCERTCDAASKPAKDPKKK